MTTNLKKDETYLINTVSQRVGLSQKRIREYEKEGLISPEREPRTNNRRYSQADIDQILHIKALIHTHGFTLACFKYVLGNVSCWTIFNCLEKEACPTYQNPHASPCYEAVKTAADAGSKNCSRCPVYLNRQIRAPALLQKP